MAIEAEASVELETQHPPVPAQLVVKGRWDVALHLRDHSVGRLNKAARPIAGGLSLPVAAHAQLRTAAPTTRRPRAVAVRCAAPVTLPRESAAHLPVGYVWAGHPRRRGAAHPEPRPQDFGIAVEEAMRFHHARAPLATEGLGHVRAAATALPAGRDPQDGPVAVSQPPDLPASGAADLAAPSLAAAGAAVPYRAAEAVPSGVAAVVPSLEEARPLGAARFLVGADPAGAAGDASQLSHARRRRTHRVRSGYLTARRRRFLVRETGAEASETLC